MVHRRTRSRRLAVAVVAALALVLSLVHTPPAAASRPIHPGVQTRSESGQCTANFVFSDGVDVFLGQSAHCTSPNAATAADGCVARTLPLGSSVKIEGATRPGTLAYSSWITMQHVGERDASACAYNDFALVRVHPDDHSRVTARVPFFGGPVCLDSDGLDFGERVVSYGNSSLRLGVGQLRPKEGYAVGTAPDGWTHDVYTITPGIPGDSGSAFLDARGCAFGVLSTLDLAPLPASNGVTDLRRALDYMRAHTPLDAVSIVLHLD